MPQFVEQDVLSQEVFPKKIFISSHHHPIPLTLAFLFVCLFVCLFVDLCIHLFVWAHNVQCT